MRTATTPATDTISGVVSGAGVLTYGTPGTLVTRNGTGTYTITLPVGYVVWGGPVGSPAGGGSFVVGFGASAQSRTFTINLFNSTTGALADAQFTFSVLARNVRQPL